MVYKYLCWDKWKHNHGNSLMFAAGGVVKDQAEADEGTSLKERGAMAVGKIE